MSLRYLNNHEIAIAKPVFKHSLPWNRIQLSSRSGLKGSLYTMGRTINVGPYYYRGMDAAYLGPEYLIHELTHVWQYEHRAYGGSYIFDSGYAQLVQGQVEAYKYTAGGTWDSYSAEQQAEIVKDWFNNGQRQNTQDKLFAYVRDNIWPKRMSPDDDPFEKVDAATFERKSGY